MHIRSLRIFCDVVRAGSFSRAASENGLSQSAASQMVHHLEEHLGVPLIDRSHRPWALTAEGDYFYRGCLEILRRYGELEAKVRSFQEEVTGRVTVAAIYSVGLSDMNAYVKEFVQRYPRVEVQMRYDHPDAVEQLVLGGEVDLGLVSYPRTSRHLEVEPWRDETIVVACTPGSPLADRTSLRPEELDGLQVVGYGTHLRIRRQLDRALARCGVAVQVVMTFDNTEVMKRAIEAGAGVGLLPEPTLQRELQLGSLVAIPLVDRWGQAAMRRPLGMIHRRGQPLSATAVRFMRELRDREADVEATPVMEATVIQSHSRRSVPAVTGTPAAE